MLKIFFNYGGTNMKKTNVFLEENNLTQVPNADDYFDVVYDRSWIDTEFSRKVIKEIDKTDVVTDGVLESPFLGTIPPVCLSGGAKGLILLKFGEDHNIVLKSSVFGDNCAPYLLEIGREKDIILIGRHLIEFGKFNDDIEILNIPRVCHGYYEYIKACREVLC